MRAGLGALPTDPLLALKRERARRRGVVSGSAYSTEQAAVRAATLPTADGQGGLVSDAQIADLRRRLAVGDVVERPLSPSSTLRHGCTSLPRHLKQPARRFLLPSLTVVAKHPVGSTSRAMHQA